jgi:hypothetical protein
MRVAGATAAADEFTYAPPPGLFGRYLAFFIAAGILVNLILAIVCAVMDSPPLPSIMWPMELGLALALAFIAYLPWRNTGFALDAGGLTVWNRRSQHRIVWEDVGSARFGGSRWWSGLAVTSRDGSRTLHARTAGLEPRVLRAELARFAGADHLVTRAVAHAWR